MDVVLDTNVIASAVMTPGGIPAQVIDAWLTGRYRLVMSAAVFEEIIEVLHRPRVRALIPRTDQELGGFLDNLERESVWIDDVPGIPPLERDPKDTKIVALAAAASADLIVSGDADLLSLQVYAGIPIVNARDFVEGLAAGM